MTPAQESKLMHLGCLTVLPMLAIFGILAWLVDRRFAIGAVALFFLWAVICSIVNKREKRRLDAAFEEAFGKFTGTRPVLKTSSSYGYPQFEVEFQTVEEVALAFESGCLLEFRTSVKRLYGSGGFKISKGFGATYVGWLSDWMVRDKDPAAEARLDQLQELEQRYYGSGR